MFSLFEKPKVSHDELLTLSIDLVRQFVKHIRSLESVEEYKPLQHDYNLCIELFRYSLCLALDLPSALNCWTLEGLTDEAVSFIRGQLDKGLDKYSPEAVLQASMHCILRAKSLAEE